MNRKNLILLLGTLIVLGAVYLTYNPPKTQTPSTQPTTTQEQKFNIEQTINYGESKALEVLSTQAANGETALDLLLRAKADKVEVKDYSFGKAVEAIDGVKNGTDGKYWLYYINGEQSQV